MQSLWEAFVASDESLGNDGSDRGKHSVHVIDEGPGDWWERMAPSLQPFLVDECSSAEPLPSSSGGRLAWGPDLDVAAAAGGQGLQIQERLKSTGTRAAIFLAPCHHLLLRIWAEAGGAGVLVHITTDYWPVLYHVDRWLGGDGR